MPGPLRFSVMSTVLGATQCVCHMTFAPSGSRAYSAGWSGCGLFASGWQRLDDLRPPSQSCKHLPFPVRGEQPARSQRVIRPCPAAGSLRTVSVEARDADATPHAIPCDYWDAADLAGAGAGHGPGARAWGAAPLAQSVGRQHGGDRECFRCTMVGVGGWSLGGSGWWYSGASSSGQ
jgi:hypothetical protein